MKILVLKSSPRGSRSASNALSDIFIEKAKENGHSVTSFDVSKLYIGSCLACEYCHTKGQGKCVQKDDFEKISPALIEAEAIVFSSPIYYFSVSSQLRKVIDRFYSINSPLKDSNKKIYYIISCEDDVMDSAISALAPMKHMSRYLGWTDCGEVIALKSEDKDETVNKYGEAVKKLI